MLLTVTIIYRNVISSRRDLSATAPQTESNDKRWRATRNFRGGRCTAAFNCSVAKGITVF